jgi:hypothetical protein
MQMMTESSATAHFTRRVRPGFPVKALREVLEKGKFRTVDDARKA